MRVQFRIVATVSAHSRRFCRMSARLVTQPPLLHTRGTSGFSNIRTVVTVIAQAEPTVFFLELLLG